jgi:peptide/nickel transport system permease protein
MQTYVIKRVLLFIPTLIAITLFVFILLRLIPGDPAELILLGPEGDNSFAQEELDALRAKLGTDKPIWAEYGVWVGKMLRLDFGVSFFYDEPIAPELVGKFPITLQLTLMSVLLATVVAVPLGVLSAIRQDTWADYASRIITFSGISMPNFWVGILIIYLLVLVFDWLPTLGYVNPWENPGRNLQQLIFPALALATSNMAFIARVTRSSMLEILREDFMRTARAKGLTEPVVMYRHALKNALLPVVTVSGYEFGRQISGTVIIEVIFLVPGMGRFLIESIFRRDYAVVQAIVVLITVSVLVVNVLLDLVYAWLNPRIRYT